METATAISAAILVFGVLGYLKSPFLKTIILAGAAATSALTYFRVIGL